MTARDDTARPPLPCYDDALRTVLAAVQPLATVQVALAEARGRVLRQQVVADRDQPPFHRAAMDGFAVRRADIRPGVALPIVGDIAAGADAAACARPLQANTAVRIATGAPLPPQADAVIQIEKATVAGEVDGHAADRESSSPQASFDVETIDPWLNVHQRASDARAGDVLLDAGVRLLPHHLGIAAAVGAAGVAVTRQPRVCILTSGDEVVPPDTPAEQLQPQQIRNANGPMLAAMVQAMGGELVAVEHIRDEPEETLAAAREALGKANLVLTVGGVSVGQRDFLPDAWRQLGLTVLLHGINIQPGKPVFVAQPQEETEKLVIGLPGNPVSVWATAQLIVQPVIRKLMGLPGELPWRRVWLAEAIQPNPRRELFRAVRYVGETYEQVQPITWHGSGDLSHTSAADGLIRLPLTEQPLQPGAAVPMLEAVA